jgi:hypothetical protein
MHVVLYGFVGIPLVFNTGDPQAEPGGLSMSARGGSPRQRVCHLVNGSCWFGLGMAPEQTMFSPGALQ